MNAREARKLVKSSLPTRVELLQRVYSAVESAAKLGYKGTNVYLFPVGASPRLINQIKRALREDGYKAKVYSVGGNDTMIEVAW